MIRASLMMVALLAAAPAHAQAPSPEPVVEARSLPASPGRTKRIAGVVTTVAGAVVLIAAAALGNQAADHSETISGLFAEGGVYTQAAARIDADGRRNDVLQMVLYPVGAAIAAAGIAVAVVGWRQDRRHRVSVSPTPQGAHASWSVSF
jgi:hypothetical protein